MATFTALSKSFLPRSTSRFTFLMSLLLPSLYISITFNTDARSLHPQHTARYTPQHTFALGCHAVMLFNRVNHATNYKSAFTYPLCFMGSADVREGRVEVAEKGWDTVFIKVDWQIHRPWRGKWETCVSKGLAWLTVLVHMHCWFAQLNTKQAAFYHVSLSCHHIRVLYPNG